VFYMPNMCFSLDFSFLMAPISFSIPLVLLEHSESVFRVTRLLGPLLFMCGAGWCSSPKRVDGDGGEVPVGGEAIQDKDTE